MDAALEYDSSSIESILAYAKRLEGHTLREECPGLERVEDPHKRRGSFGNAVEKYYFTTRSIATLMQILLKLEPS